MAEKSKTQGTIQIPDTQFESLKVTLVGKTSLLTNRFGPDAIAKLEASQQKTAKGEKPPRNPEAEVLDKLYIVPPKEGDGPEDVRFGIPSSAIKQCLVTAGGRFTDEQMTKLRGVINIEGDILEIRSAPPRMRKDTGRLPNKAGTVIYRPEFTCPWSIEVPVRFMANCIRREQVLNLFNIAGFSQGIGDWRPEKDGNFGTFVIGGVEEV